MRITKAALVALSAFALTACDQMQATKNEAPEAAQQVAAEAPPASADPAYVGTWAIDAAGCTIPQEQQGAPYIFNNDGFNQHEAHCTWANVEEINATTWRIAAACQVEGDEASLGWDIAVDGDVMQMVPGPRLVRCAAG